MFLCDEGLSACLEGRGGFLLWDPGGVAAVITGYHKA